MKKIYIVGSGPAGVSTASALLKRGYKVTMLDVGRKLEESISNKISILRKQEDIDPDHFKNIFLKNKNDVDINGVQEKKIFGSSYANKLGKYFKLNKKNILIYMSFATGGLSNLWGRLMMPLTKNDIKDWPIKENSLDRYYKEVLKFVPLTGRKDSLETLLPLYTDQLYSMTLSDQARLIDKKLKKNKYFLESQGLMFGQSRLAACFDGSFGESGKCIQCGLCLYGCIYDDLYSSAWTVRKLLKDKNFEYITGHIVDYFETKNNNLNVHTISDLDGSLNVFIADKVFLAAGSIASTRIIMKSKKIFNQKVKLKVSDFYVMPSLTLFASKKVVRQKLNSCCQYFIQIYDRNIDNKLINLQIYTYTDYYINFFQRYLKGFFPFFKPLINFILNRFIVIFCYINSENSSHMELQLSKTNVLNVEGKYNPMSLKIFNRLKRKLFRLSFKTGIVPIPFFNGEQEIGNSVHYGGSMPMTKKSDFLNTDHYGEVSGFKNLHVVDSSIFPTIPSTSPTFVIMANAYRIGYEVKI